MSEEQIPGESISISVVVPVYGCCGCLSELCQRLERVLTPLTLEFQIVLVDDGSPDGAWNAILELQSRYSQVCGVRLSRNFGQHIAIMAGLAHSRGDYTVVMDCDLQDPPELVPTLLAKAREGFDIVLARRDTRSHSAFRVWMANLYFHLLSLISGQKIDGRFGTFSLLSRKVVAAFVRFDEPEFHYVFILRYIGFSIGIIDYDHAARLNGKSSYSLVKLVRHAMNGILFQSTGFLSCIIACGLFFGLSGILLAGYFCYLYFLHGSVPGWTSLAVLILVCSGTIETSVGVIGLYVGKIFSQSKNRPLYFIDQVVGASQTTDDLKPVD